jgi:hypothetical protein
MRAPLKILWISTALLVSSAVLAEVPWKHVGTLGQRHLMVVDASVQDNAEQLKQAALTVCAPGKPCLVAFWADAAAVPAAMPMTSQQQQAMVAQYLRNPASGKETLLLKCPPYNTGNIKCLH